MKRSFLFGLIVFLALTAVPAHASLIFVYQGLTGAGSSMGSDQIGAGTGYRIEATFSETPVLADTGAGLYAVDSIRVGLGPSWYTATFTWGEYVLAMYDPTNSTFPGEYRVTLGTWGPGGALATRFSGALPSGWSASAPTPAIFVDYLGALDHSVPFNISGTTLTLDFDPANGLDARIIAGTATPEPAGLLLGLTGLAVIGLFRRR